MTGAVTTGLRPRIEDLAARLEAEGIASATAEAEGLIGAVLGVHQRHALYATDTDLDTDEVGHLEGLLARRLMGEPLQYVTGEAAFRLLTLKVDHRALIPRPETEGLVEIALRLMKDRHGSEVLDAGTGSGAIALSLALEAPSWTVLAVDASQEALELARENHERYGIGRIRWLQADLRDRSFWRTIPPVDLLISNPPYVREEEWSGLPDEIREYEPREALVAGPEGLDMIEPLLEGAAMRVKPGGLVLIEIGLDHEEPVTALAKTLGFQDVRIAPDLALKPRYLIAEQRRAEVA